MPVYVIAELGSLAEGSLETMLRQVEAAAEAGCSAVKAQWLSNPQRLVERRKAQDYAGAYQHIAYPLAWLETLRDRAKMHGMEFGCSVYLSEDVPFLAKMVDFLKVASFEAEDRALTDAIDALVPSVRVIASVGMGAGARQSSNWEHLHCISAYPAPLQQLNLGRIRAEGLDGFSDHSADLLTGAFAVAADARIIEFHLRLADSNQANPDYACALDPDQAKHYVGNIALAEAMMGDGWGQAQPCEADMLRYRVRS